MSVRQRDAFRFLTLVAIVIVAGSSSPAGSGGFVVLAGAVECKSADDCVPSACCHATSCVPKTSALAPKGTCPTCDNDCVVGTLDCGGSCKCSVEGKCEAMLYLGMSSGGGGGHDKTKKYGYRHVKGTKPHGHKQH